MHQVSVESGDGGKRSVVITVELPEVRQFSQLSLELAEKKLRLEGCCYKLEAPLPLPIDPDRAAAKFSAKIQRLKITVPEV